MRAISFLNFFVIFLVSYSLIQHSFIKKSTVLCYIVNTILLANNKKYRAFFVRIIAFIFDARLRKITSKHCKVNKKVSYILSRYVLLFGCALRSCSSHTIIVVVISTIQFLLILLYWLNIVLLGSDLYSLSYYFLRIERRRVLVLYTSF